MPYRLSENKKCVLKKEGSSWKIHKCYDGPDATTRAKKLLAALNINVMAKETEDGDQADRRQAG